MAESAAQSENSVEEPQCVSTAQVSCALGVSVSTVKRWVDEGILPAHKTAGGHRRLYLTDVLGLVKKNDFPRVDLSVFGPCVAVGTNSTNKAAVDELYSALQAGDGDRIRRLIKGGFRSGMSLAAIADDMISPAMRQVGGAWQEGRTDILHEHRGTQLCIAALYEVRAMLESHGQKYRPVAIGGAVEQDHSTLPTLLAQMVLLEAEWNAINLGPHTPIGTFRQAIRQHRPKLIWISASHLNDVETFVAEYMQLQIDAEREGIAIAIGGRAIDEDIRSRISFSTFGGGLAHLAEFANSLNPGRRPPKRGRPRK